jgi:hypothetical protein
MPPLLNLHLIIFCLTLLGQFIPFLGLCFSYRNIIFDLCLFHLRQDIQEHNFRHKNKALMYTKMNSPKAHKYAKIEIFDLEKNWK